LDYLVIGNITKDKTETGYQIGGTSAYSGLTAQAFGLDTAILSAGKPSAFDLSKYKNLPVLFTQGEDSTIFENRYNGIYREQILHQWAGMIDITNLPDSHKKPGIVHFGPIAKEIDPSWAEIFSSSYKGITIQGLMREWDNQGRIKRAPYILLAEQCQLFDAIIFSIEDVCEDEDIIEAYANQSEVLAVTEGKNGVRIYWHGDHRHFSAPQVKEVSDTGAGDIFATAFFYRHQQTQNPWEAARFATQIAAFSVTRIGMDSVPTLDEINQQIIEIL
jgi:hypothetical protein